MAHNNAPPQSPLSPAQAPCADPWPVPRRWKQVKPCSNWSKGCRTAARTDLRTSNWRTDADSLTEQSPKHVVVIASSAYPSSASSFAIHSKRILPVSSSCIMPCLIWRTLARRDSSAASSASMSLRTVATAICSPYSGTTTGTFVI